MKFTTPLSVYVLWHPDFMEGQDIADSLYKTLCRDSVKPLVRSIGIPVYFRSTNQKNKNSPLDIDFSESEYTAIIALVTNEFLLDENYKKYIEQVHQVCLASGNKSRIYPVALSNNAYNVSASFPAINFIKIEKSLLSLDKDCIQKIKTYIKSCVLHELCRLLMNRIRSTEEKESLEVAPPVKLFISHSKHDDSKYDAIKFRDYINSTTHLKTFFDVNDIAYGSNFGEEIKKAAHAKNSALVVFQSDSYSDREWCRIEVIEAKSAGCPLVIVNAIQNGEKRAFPYLGNCPSIRLKDNFQEIIDITLEHILFNQFIRRYIDSLTDLYSIKGTAILSTTPELFDFIQLRKMIDQKKEDNCNFVVYPDPPVGSEEINLLTQLDDRFIFVTPLMLPSLV
jgi:hypothetical protein